MVYSQADLESLINKFHDHKTESHEIDGKENLPLTKEGDKAFFIRHIAALANNVSPSYLIIGIENRTWDVKGITTDSLLLDSDQTQSRMNQILEHKLDPQLSVRYKTYDYQNKKIGVVSIEGIRAPYVIAINDVQFGGERTNGAPCLVYRGAIYVRQGDTTVITNRQSRILEIIQKSERDRVGMSAQNDYIIKHNYVDIDSPDFGHNQLTDQLVERIRSRDTNTNHDQSQATTWASIVYSPISGNWNIDTGELVSKLKPDKRIGREGMWFHELPRSVSDILHYARRTPRSYFGKRELDGKVDPDKYNQFISILPAGHIEFAATYPLFYNRDDIRFFSFINLIGYLWQLTYLAKAIYSDAGYQGEVLILLNLVGTSGTRLADFARGERRKWVGVFDWEYNNNPNDVSQEKNIQIQRQLFLESASDVEIENTIRDIAKELGNYYNLDTPRCFTPDTNEFPVRDYQLKNQH